MTVTPGEETREQFYRRYITTAMRPTDPDDVAAVLMSVDATVTAIEARLNTMAIDPDRLTFERGALNSAAQRIRQTILDAEAEQPGAAQETVAQAAAPAVAQPAAPLPQSEDVADPAAPVTQASGQRPGLNRRTLIESAAGLTLGVPGLLWWRSTIAGWLPASVTVSRVPVFAPQLDLVSGWNGPEAGLVWARASPARVRLTRSSPSHKKAVFTLSFHGVGGRAQDATLTTTEATPQVMRVNGNGKPDKKELTFVWPMGVEVMTVDVQSEPLIRPSDYGSQDARVLGVGIAGAASAP